MVTLYEKDKDYLDKIEARSAVFVGHDNVVDKAEYYKGYITSAKFLNILLDLLETNRAYEHYSYEIKHNILKMLEYARDELLKEPNTNTDKYELIRECKRVLNKTPGEEGVAKFYKSQYIKRNSECIPLKLNDVPILFSNIYRIEEKDQIDKSISFEGETLNILLYGDEQVFLRKEILHFLLNNEFIDTLNITLVDNPGLFNYFDFKEKAEYVLITNIQLEDDKSPLYSVVEREAVQPAIISRSKLTLRRIMKMK